MNNYFQQIGSKIQGSIIYKKLSLFTKRTSLPGFENIPIYNIGKFLIHELEKDDITTRANSMAFSFFISFFPFLIVIFSIVSYFPIDDLQSVVKSIIHGFMPLEAEKYIMGLVADAFSRDRGDLLSIGFILSIYFASNGMEAMMRGFEKQYTSTFMQTNWIVRRLIAIKLTFQVGFLFLLSVFVILGSIILINWLNANTMMGNFEYFSFQAIRWFLMIIVIYAIVSFIYHYAPRMRKKFSFFSPGTNLAAIMIFLVSLGFTYFVNQFGDYNKFYGSLGTLVMIMLLIQINSFILLAGFELNASIAVNRDILEKKKNETTK